MKKPLSIVGLLIAIPVLFFLVVSGPILARWITPPCILPTSYHIARMHWIEKRGEMEWSGDVEKAVAHLHECTSDTTQLVQRLLSDKSGTVVSLGMDIIMHETLDNGDVLLRQHLNDKRWNHNLALNDEYARFALVVWKKKKKVLLDQEDKKTISRWPSTYFESFGVAL